MIKLISLFIGWGADLFIGDPAWLPHPVVGFGKLISWGEHLLNRGNWQRLKGGLLAVTLIGLVFTAVWFLPRWLDALWVFFCLAGTTLIREVRQVFIALDHSLDEGRQQVARIVGRDTTHLSAQEVRTAALETLAENLSDGVVAPLFWFALLGAPGMMAYKMINTLDSMIGYRTERYRRFGTVAARIDDITNYIPARLTAFLMILPSTLSKSSFRLFSFVWKYGRCHASPNSGYPEAALAGILNCRFGGPHTYFGEVFDKPYIGSNERELTTADMKKAVRVNRTAEILMLILTGAVVTLEILLCHCDCQWL